MPFLTSKQTFATAAILVLLSSFLVHGRGCWRSRMVSPRRYHFLNRWHGSRDAFDLVSDMMNIPIYYNSLIREREAELETPLYTVSRAGDALELSLEIPGVSAKDLSVELVDGNLIRIRGSRKLNDEQGSEVGTMFHRTFRLNEDLDVDNVKVNLSSGILKIHIPKKQKVIQNVPITVIDDEKVEVETRNLNQKDDVTIEVEAKTIESGGLDITEEDVDTL